MVNGYSINPSSNERKSVGFMFRKIWIVQEGLAGGYMPNNLSFFATKHEAQSYMLNRKESAIDEGYTVTGSAKDGYYSLMPDGASEYNCGESITLDYELAGSYVPGWVNKYDSFAELIQDMNDFYVA